MYQGAKSIYFHSQFDKYKKDSKKTWDLIKILLNTNKNKKDFPDF